MKIRWLGHASFLITTGNGTKIITDPYTPGGELHYGEIKESADIVTVSHEHHDHGNVKAVKGNPVIVKNSSEVKGISFRGIPTHHDEAGGSKRGTNTVFCFTVDGVSICHLGDLGHTLSAKQTADIGKVDILMVPVGGYYTIDARTASQVVDQLKPKVTIPMHFKNPGCSFPITGVGEFLESKKNVEMHDSSEIELTAGTMPLEPQIIILKPAL